MRADPTARALAALLDDEETSDEQRVGRIVGAVPAPTPRLRLALALLGLLHGAATFPWLLGADPFDLLEGAHESHLARDGALGVAIVAAALLTAWRPRWALPASAIAAVALVAQLVAGLLDGTISSIGADEGVHLLAVLTTVLVARAGTRLRPLGRPRPPRLRAVPPPEP